MQTCLLAEVTSDPSEHLRQRLLIAGENAHSRYFSEDAYKTAGEPKELVIIPNAVHVDLYDKVDVIPFDKLADFFTKNLK